MPGQTSIITPNFIVTPNIPNTIPAVQIIGINPTRTGLLISNISANILWLSPAGVTAVQGTIQSGQIPLAVAATILFGGVNSGVFVGGTITQFAFNWTGAMFAIAAAGATNIVTVLEFNS